MSEEAEAAGPGQGEDRDGSFFAIFGEEPGPTMEISHQQVLFQSNPLQSKILNFQVASKLLSDGLLLTALELHTELLETGRELPRFYCILPLIVIVFVFV